MHTVLLHSLHHIPSVDRMHQPDDRQAAFTCVGLSRSNNALEEAEVELEEEEEEGCFLCSLQLHSTFLLSPSLMLLHLPCAPLESHSHCEVCQ